MERTPVMSAVAVDRLCGDQRTLSTDHSIDAQMAARIRSGDWSAFEQLVRSMQPGVYGLITRITGDAEEARDLAQETFLRAYQRIDQFRAEASLKTWIYSIATRLACNHRRWWFRRRLGRTLSLADASERGRTAGWTEIADTVPDSEQCVIDREREVWLMKALRRLPRSYRAAVLLRDVEGYSYEEIATVLHVSIGTVKSRISRGRELLRREMSNNGIR